MLHTKAPYPPLTRSPFPMRGRLVWRRLRRLFLLGRCPEVAFKSLVTSHSYDTREGIVSHAWHEILRLSPLLFWRGLFSHRGAALGMTIGGWHGCEMRVCVFLSNEIGDGMEVSPSKPCM